MATAIAPKEERIWCECKVIGDAFGSAMKVMTKLLMQVVHVLVHKVSFTIIGVIRARLRVLAPYRTTSTTVLHCHHQL